MGPPWPAVLAVQRPLVIEVALHYLGAPSRWAPRRHGEDQRCFSSVPLLTLASLGRCLGLVALEGAILEHQGSSAVAGTERVCCSCAESSFTQPMSNAHVCSLTREQLRTQHLRPRHTGLCTLVRTAQPDHGSVTGRLPQAVEMKCGSDLAGPSGDSSKIMEGWWRRRDLNLFDATSWV